jgi:hypothetical protein
MPTELWWGNLLEGDHLEVREGDGMVKIKLSLCLTNYHAMKTYWESGCTAPRILNLCTRWK